MTERNVSLIEGGLIGIGVAFIAWGIFTGPRVATYLFIVTTNGGGTNVQTILFDDPKACVSAQNRLFEDVKHASPDVGVAVSCEVR